MPPMLAALFFILPWHQFHQNAVANLRLGKEARCHQLGRVRLTASLEMHAVIPLWRIRAGHTTLGS